ncbi:bifunctional ligase/repressor BirA [Sulfurimicrobium lacus]|uniref:Bifunctional ligase/repressor BirA n=1 Tax=Sulfurimicrobium lacus TaxID=2715678 RepID=A0A6F8VHA9_9PROT|nr:biotin--[acetyl-CoA-carboxylase] ligase [Sulfurimicrobium lacus]BCB28487.1 bifunctional ligase/repressor BirA [Sulfurimicrobium lacus]
MKPLAFTVLRQLSSDEFRSGEQIARELNISRASVWQALRDLDRHGIRLFRLAGRGYRLAEPLHWLDAAAVESALGDKAALFDLEVMETAASSNSILMQKAALGAGHGSCIAVELQTGGRGRRGRTWHASLGGSLTFSLLWRFNQGASYLSGLSLAVGVALMRALHQAGISTARLKWPNDVLHENSKLAGILIELQGDMLGPSAAVIGIGLNLKLSDQARENIDQAAIDLAALAPDLPTRSQLLALILGHLGDVLQQFEAHGFAALREEWSRHHAYHQQPVRMLMPDGSTHHGTVSGVADDGALLVRDADGERRFTSGEVSMRSDA